MSTLHTAPAKRPATLAKSLLRLERRGRYGEALAEVEHLWADIRVQPDVDNFGASEAAEIILRCGNIIGLHGHNEQIENAQIISKDLITDALRRFSDLGDRAKIAECENDLALAYWRTGEYNEALACVESSLAHDIPRTSDARLHAHVNFTLINLAFKRYQENVEYGLNVEDDFRQCESDFLIGSLCANLGISYKNLGRVSEARTHFELAKYHHERSRHGIFLGTAENNLAQIYRATGKFRLAHAAIDNAGRIFKRLKDKTREGFMLDTKALVYFAEKDYAQALTTVDKALAILKKSENTGYQVETLMTKVKVLLYLDGFSSAVLTLIEAVEIARHNTDDKMAISLIDDFETMLKERSSPRPPDIALEKGHLELVLPPSIANFSEYRGVWINNTGLEAIGLPKGSLAVVVKVSVDRGDLIAISEIESGEVSCGFYDADFGIVCLEGASGEPQIFNETDIQILGKIVGVNTLGKDKDGKMAVKSLNL